MPDRILNRINTISRNDLYTWCDEYINQNQKKILDLVRNRMMQGDDTEGGIIGVYRSINYSLFKQKENPLAGGTVDLFLTGDLQRQLRIEKEGKNYKIWSKDWKYDDLYKKYGGAKAFGLTEEQHIQVIEEMLLYCYDKIITKMLG